MTVLTRVLGLVCVCARSRACGRVCVRTRVCAWGRVCTRVCARARVPVPVCANVCVTRGRGWEGVGSVREVVRPQHSHMCVLVSVCQGLCARMCVYLGGGGGGSGRGGVCEGVRPQAGVCEHTGDTALTCVCACVPVRVC